MLLQTNSYIVPKEKRAEHARLLRRFRLALAKLGCDSFEVYEQVGSNWSSGEPTGRYVQIMRFRDRRHQLAVQAAERTDSTAQAIIAEFCQLINFPYQQQQGLFAVGFYNAVLQAAPARTQPGEGAVAAGHEAATAVAGSVETAEPGPHSVDPAEGPAGEHEDYVPMADAVADAEPESPVAGVLLAEADEMTGDLEDVEEAVTPTDKDAGGAQADADAEMESARDAEGEVEAAAETGVESTTLPFSQREAQSEAAGDELGALLDAHLDESAAPDDGAGSEDALGEMSDDRATDKPEGLEALDLDDLDLPDGPMSGPEQQQNHVAR